ncbi:MAG: energy-coupling factor transporter ATPase [Bacillota bacterium]|jgi:energy-coupling factor transport system ATP-binding protein|nr:energy-coupling factor transporter ATPase [Candidatus Fermentithermobacillaceae bacterium]
MPIEVRSLTHIYHRGSTSEAVALKDVSFRIDNGEFVGLIGPTGSGKSTLIQHLNGLLKPTSGEVLVDGQNIWDKGMSLRKLRQRVGLVFQYAEQQVFEETVRQDIAFGPRNLGLSEREVMERVEEAARMVGLPADLLDRSPFELSGGQLRRVAIAGVAAMKPEVLILDEPAAGLDPRGRDGILSRIQEMHRGGMTVILVSHNMEDVARLCGRLLVLNKGELVADGTPREVFSRNEFVKKIGLRAPDVVNLMEKLRERGWNVRTDIVNVDEALKEILRELGKEAPVLS